MRTSGGTLPLTAQMKNEILSKVATYATGRETMRCLALATVDKPPAVAEFKLDDSSTFKDYEVYLIFLFFLNVFFPSFASPAMHLCLFFRLI